MIVIEPGDVVDKIDGDIVRMDLTISDILDNGDNSELLSRGSRGKGVEEVQQMLDDMGYDLGEKGIDGEYGKDTAKAVRKYQEDKGLNLIDGIVGIETSTALKRENLNEQEEEKVDDPKKADLVDDDVTKFLDTLKDFKGEIGQQEKGGYDYQKDVETFQIGLELLGYHLPQYGVDGLFGPETAGQLNKFKEDNEIEYKKQKKGIFDEESSTKMNELLKDKSLIADDIKKYLDTVVELEDYQEELKTAGVESLNDNQFMNYFFDEIFEKLGVTPTEEKKKFFTAWRQAESGSAKYNPFNTTKTMNVNGVTNYNSVGVKNYPDMSTGIMATVKTLKLPYYKGLMEMLNDDTITAEELASSKDLKTWGTGTLVSKVLNKGKV